LEFNIVLIVFLINLRSRSIILLRYLSGLNIVVFSSNFSDFSCFIAQGYAGLRTARGCNAKRLPVLIISGLSCFLRIFFKNLYAGSRFLVADNIKSIVFPSESIALYKYFHFPFTSIEVSSTRQDFPTDLKFGRILFSNKSEYFEPLYIVVWSTDNLGLSSFQRVDGNLTDNSDTNAGRED